VAPKAPALHRGYSVRPLAAAGAGGCSGVSGAAAAGAGSNRGGSLAAAVAETGPDTPPPERATAVWVVVISMPSPGSRLYPPTGDSISC